MVQSNNGVADGAGVWSTEQTYHGGQDWKFLNNFEEDFSVTTNSLGTPQGALKACLDHLRHNLHHYPPANCEPAKTHFARWLWSTTSYDWNIGHGRLVLGNGASELIDLVVREAVANGCVGGCKTGPHTVQYKEYERAYKATGHKILSEGETMVGNGGGLLCLVNPNNPTGNYMNVEKMKEYIKQNAAKNSTVIVDESMQMWIGENWREDSLINQTAWIETMKRNEGISVWIIHSWTKIWSCPGIRIGSAIAPTEEDAKSILSKQVPWSVNAGALAFLQEVIKDDQYMRDTWNFTPLWRKHACEQLKQHFQWNIYGEPFLSWIWIDTLDEVTAERAVRVAKDAGLPIRWGKLGYEQPTCIRLAVRNETLTDKLVKALIAGLSSDRTGKNYRLGE